MFSKKKKVVTFENEYYDYSKNADIKKTSKEVSLKKEVMRYKGPSFFDKIFFNNKRVVKFPPYKKFLDTLQDVINNYKNKPGFSKADAIKMTGEKLKNKTLIALSASLGDKQQVLIMLEQAKDPMYYQFQEVILEQSLDKTLEILKLMFTYLEAKKEYDGANKYMQDTIMLYLMGYIIGVVQWLATPYMAISQEMVPLDKFFARWDDKLSLMFVTPIIALMGLKDNIFYQIQYGIEVFILFILPFFIIYFAFKTITQFLKDKNIRLLDKAWNEYNYITILRIKTIQMKLGKDRYQKTNYFFFLKSIGVICYDRGLMNIDYYKDFNKLVQVFEAIQKIVPYKEVRNLTELFYVNFSNILEAYKGYITGNVKKFNLGYIHDKFAEIQPILAENIKKSAYGYLMIKYGFVFFATLIISFITGMIQMNGMNELVDMMGEAMQ